MSLVWISKPVVSRIDEKAMSLSVFLLLYLRFSLSLSQFQASFLLFIAIFVVLFRCFKGTSFVGKYSLKATLGNQSVYMKETEPKLVKAWNMHSQKFVESITG